MVCAAPKNYSNLLDGVGINSKEVVLNLPAHINLVIVVKFVAWQFNVVGLVGVAFGPRNTNPVGGNLEGAFVPNVPKVFLPMASVSHS